LTRQSVQQTADGLEKDGFIAYSENPHHLPSKLMRLTPRGRTALDYVQQRHEEWANGIGGSQTIEGLQTALHLLQQVQESLDQTMLNVSEASV